MTGDWPVRPIGDLTENFDSIRVPVKEPDRRAGQYPYYGASGIVDYVDGYLFDGEYLLIAEDGENLKTRTTPVAFLAKGRFWVNNHAHIVRANSEADTRYLMYATAHMDISGYLTGSTMPKLTQANLNRIPVSAPSPNQQRAIAHILGTLDDKIELNRRMNEGLEAMARAIFKSWFVDFDPVRAKMEGRQPFGMDAETATLFPDSFEDSPRGKIRKGWKVDEIKATTTRIQYGLTRSASEKPIGPRFLRITDIQGGQIDWRHVPYCAVGEDENEKFRIKPGDIFVARTGASTGENVYVTRTPDAVFASYFGTISVRTPLDGARRWRVHANQFLLRACSWCSRGVSAAERKCSSLGGRNAGFPPAPNCRAIRQASRAFRPVSDGQ